MDNETLANCASPTNNAERIFANAECLSVYQGTAMMPALAIDCVGTEMMDNARAVVIDGHAIVSAAVGTAAELLSALRQGRRFECERERLVPTETLLGEAQLQPREAKKLDRFTLLGFVAARRILATSPMTPAEVASCGMYVGNMLAGWTFTEPQIRMLHSAGAAAVSPYLATAWFPASLQGHATIALGMHGLAKTITTDRCSGAQAIGMAFHHLRQGGQGPMFAGGVEAPVTPLVEAALGSAAPLAEGAGLLRLSAVVGEPPRGALIVGAHTSFRTGASSLAIRLRDFIAQQRPGLPAAVVCNVPPTGDGEAMLHGLLRQLLGEDLLLLFPGRCVGETLGASGGIAVALACEVLTQLVPTAQGVLVVSLGHQCTDLLWLHSKRGSHDAIEYH